VPLIVDGMNVIGSQPDGWWRDRGAARRRLVVDLSRLGDDAEITVVFDGRPTTGEMVSGLVRPADTVVVTSDRALVERVRQLGTKVESAQAFRSRLAIPPSTP
jgi:predicted RNA-binding protein with PIN domain